MWEQREGSVTAARRHPGRWSRLSLETTRTLNGKPLLGNKSYANLLESKSAHLYLLASCGATPLWGLALFCIQALQRPNLAIGLCPFWDILIMCYCTHAKQTHCQICLITRGSMFNCPAQSSTILGTEMDIKSNQTIIICKKAIGSAECHPA